MLTRKSQMKLTEKPQSTAPFRPRVVHPPSDLLFLNLTNSNRNRNRNRSNSDKSGNNRSIRRVKRVGSSGRRRKIQQKREEGGGGRRKEGVVVSARKLAAGLWRIREPVAVERTRRLEVQLEPSHHFSNLAMEGATKWDPVRLEPLHEICQIYSHTKRIDQQVSAVPIVTGLQAQLKQARLRIQELESEHQSSKKKLEHFMKKVGEERASWRSSEHEKIRVFIDDVKADLNRARKKQKRLEIVNSKLVNELADAKVSGKWLMQNYEKERKAGVLIKEVCDELAMEITKDKAVVERLKKESLRLREEVEEERKMLQMAEVWREEHVQMKLIDVKVTLEEKYSLMNKLVADLQNFLRSRNAVTDLKEMQEAESLLPAATLVNIQDIKDFQYEPPNPDDIFSLFEDVNFGETNERVVEQCATYSPASPASKIHTVSPQINLVKKDADFRQSNAFVQNGDLEDDESEWETVSHLEDLGSSYSPEGSVRSVNNIHLNGNVSGGGTEWEENACDETPTKNLRKASSCKSAPNNGDIYEEISVDVMNGMFSNGRKSHGCILSPDQGSSKGRLSPVDVVEHWSSPESGNPRITCGMKGCIEWPRGIQKSSLKSKLLDATMDSQKKYNCVTFLDRRWSCTDAELVQEHR